MVNFNGSPLLNRYGPGRTIKGDKMKNNDKASLMIIMGSIILIGTAWMSLIFYGVTGFLIHQCVIVALLFYIQAVLYYVDGKHGA